MQTTKTFLTLALALAVVMLIGSGSVVTAGDQPTVGVKQGQFHYGPFAPGAKLMGPAPEPGLAFLDKSENAVVKSPESLKTNSITLKPTKQ
jgi:hypothetical protein